MSVEVNERGPKFLLLCLYFVCFVIPFDYFDRIDLLLEVLVVENHLNLMMKRIVRYLNEYWLTDLKLFLNEINFVAMNSFDVDEKMISFVHSKLVLHPFLMKIHFHLIDDKVVHDDRPEKINQNEKK